MKSTQARTHGMVLTALFAAMILIMAFVPGLGYIPLGITRATTLHIPVIIGSIALGPKRGALLGLLFGLTSLVNNTFSPTLTSFVFTPFYSVGGVSGNFWSLLICFLPRALTGVVPYYVCRALSRLPWRGFRSCGAATLAVAGFAGSMTNTLLVMNMIFIFFGENYAAAKETAYQALYGVILAVIGTNGVPEALVAAVLTSAIIMALGRAGISIYAKRGADK